MNITVERQPNCEAKLQVEIPAEPVTEERQRIVRAFSSKARLPGFRPGKVPRTVIEKRFGERITAELEATLIQKAIREAAEREHLRILDAKAPEDITLHPDGRLTFSSKLTISPEFDLPDYKNVTLEVPNRVIGDEDVASELENLQNRFADYRDIEDRALQGGDFAVIDYSSQLDGKPLEEAFGQSVGYLAGGEDYWLKMEDDSILPGFSGALEGAGLGEERDFRLKAPQDFDLEELRGVDLDFHVTLKGIKEQVLPDLDDEFAAQVIPDGTMKDLRETIHGNLDRQLNQRIEEFKINQLLEKLVSGIQFDLPPDLIVAETQGQADEMVARGMSSGMSEDEIAARQEEIFSVANQRARMNLRTDFVLQRIAEEEKIAVTQEELANRVVALANQAKKPIKSFANELKQSGRLRGLQHSMLLSKTIDFLLEHAKVEIVEDNAPETDPQEPSVDAPAPARANDPEAPAESAPTESPTHDD